MRHKYIAKIKQIKPPNTSPKKYEISCSKSFIEKCSLDKPKLLKNADKTIMMTTEIQPFSRVFVGKRFFMLKKNKYPIKQPKTLTSGDKKSMPISEPWTEMYHIK